MKNQKPQTLVGMTAVCSGRTQIKFQLSPLTEYNNIYFNWYGFIIKQRHFLLVDSP